MQTNVNAGRIVCVGDVDDVMHGNLIEALSEVNETKRRFITLVLSTEGGDVHAGFAIYDLIRSNPKPVHVLVNGQCNSSGTLILQAGAIRQATAHSSILIHFGCRSSTSFNEAAFEERQHRKWVELLTERTSGKTSYDEMEIMHRGETYLTANDALLHGLIDSITDKVL